MNTVVLLAENVTGAASVEQALKPLGSVTTLNLLGSRLGRVIPSPSSIRLVVSKASSGSNLSLDAVETFLRTAVADSTPHILLLPRDAPRPSWVDGPTSRTCVLPSDSEGRLVATALALLGEATPESLAVAPAVSDTVQVLSEMFAAGRGGGAIEPSTIATGSESILDAVKEANLRTWVDLVRRFDDAVHQHCLLVAGLVGGLTKSLGFSAADCRRLTQAALVHDVGKAKIPIKILNSPNPLTPEERVIINTHPRLGHDMLLGKGFSDEIMAVVRSHHELLDGSGYPDGLRGAQIPDMIRLVTICDIFAAMIERRSYKPSRTPEEGLSALRDMGPKIDQLLLRACRAYLS